MNRRSIEDRDMDDMEAQDDFRLAKRVWAAFAHPDCPVVLLDCERLKLARHVAIRLNRTNARFVKNGVENGKSKEK